jgi:hypothetical protein
MGHLCKYKVEFATQFLQTVTLPKGYERCRACEEFGLVMGSLFVIIGCLYIFDPIPDFEGRIRIVCFEHALAFLSSTIGLPISTICLLTGFLLLGLGLYPMFHKHSSQLLRIHQKIRKTSIALSDVCFCYHEKLRISEHDSHEK